MNFRYLPLLHLLVVTECIAFNSPLLISQFDGAASLAPCTPGFTADDGRSAAFECGGAILWKRELPSDGYMLVSRTPDGSLPNRGSAGPIISGQNDQVVYVSIANNIVLDDFNDNPSLPDVGGFDVFLFDLITDANQRIGFDRNGSEVPFPGIGYGGITPDFQRILLGSRQNLGFLSDANGEEDVFYQDRQSGQLELISQRNDGTTGPERSIGLGISDNGDRIFFRSANAGIVDADQNGIEDIFIYWRLQDRFDLAVTRFDGLPLGEFDGRLVDIGRVGGAGRYLTFTFEGTGLVEGVSSNFPQVYTTDIETGITRLVSRNLAGEPANQASYGPEVSIDGSIVAFSSDATDLIDEDGNGVGDIFVRDMNRGLTVAVSRSTDGNLGNAQSGGESEQRPIALSRSGQYLQFASAATNFTSAGTNGVFQVYFLNVFSTFPTQSVPTAGEPQIVLLILLTLGSGIFAFRHPRARN